MPKLSDLSRRRFLGGAAALGATAALAACGYKEESAGQTGGTGNGSGSQAAWASYTDDRGRTYDGDRPERIVAQVTAAAALWEFGVRPIGIFGPSRGPGGKKDPLVGSVDLSKVTSLGSVWGEFNYDKYVSLRPELLISVMYLREELWYVPAEQVDAVEKAAPTVGVDLAGVSMPDGIEKFRELAKVLGGDVEAESVNKAKATFDKASEDFSGAVDAAKGKKVLLVAANADGFWAGNAKGFPSSKQMAEAGLTFVEPKAPGDGNYWEQLSWENAGKYRSDVILLDDRDGFEPDKLNRYPTWSELPAVKAGHVYAWNPETPFTYQAAAEQLNRIGAELRKL